jgi:hypothetical protein
MAASLGASQLKVGSVGESEENSQCQLVARVLS